MHDELSQSSRGAYVIAPDDDVAVAVRALTAGEHVALRGSGHAAVLEVREAIPAGHKIALHDIAAGESVRKYGWPIGRASAQIARGALVHTNNLATQLAGLHEYDFRPSPAQTAATLPRESTFMGYRRSNGRVGTRNEIWILATVGCVTRTAQRIANQGAQRFAGRVEGVHAFTHPFGCSQLGDDLKRTRSILAALARHPNAGGVLIIGLGCESNELQALLHEVGDVDPARLCSFNAQAAEDEVEQGLAALEQLVTNAERDRRERCALSELVVGLKCGGSDGFS